LNAAAAVVNEERHAWKEPVVRRAADYQTIFGQRNVRQARPNRIKKNAFSLQAAKFQLVYWRCQTRRQLWHSHLFLVR
jgi:hypothetical protein